MSPRILPVRLAQPGSVDGYCANASHLREHYARSGSRAKGCGPAGAFRGGRYLRRRGQGRLLSRQRRGNADEDAGRDATQWAGTVA
ncbi:hypothetical protein C882_2816 [Caenispirillum salinarum AK4]|uniref:Uncharacterized protein n=1 Tax=Caenispirillum salinarum AK4 TaxID=1238182 RepID=K9HC70_9PROT|nr:hypothetical protein C882_2816 [Caenispirillum salinarum AK4]